MNKKLRTHPLAGQVYLSSGQYGNGNPAIRMMCADDDSPWTTCSVNPPPVSIETSLGNEATFNDLLPGEVAVKDWSENSGILDWLIAEGVVAAPHRHIRSGFVRISVCKLLQNPETGEAL